MQTNLWDLEQTFAPFPAKIAPLSFTYERRITLTVHAQAQKKEMLIFRCDMVLLTCLWIGLQRIRVKHDCSIRESAYCKVVSVFNSTQLTQEICRDSLGLFSGLSYLHHFEFNCHIFSLQFRIRTKVLVLSNQWYNLYANPFWREHETKRKDVALSSLKGRVGWGGVGFWPGASWVKSVFSFWLLFPLIGGWKREKRTNVTEFFNSSYQPEWKDYLKT